MQDTLTPRTTMYTQGHWITADRLMRGDVVQVAGFSPEQASEHAEVLDTVVVGDAVLVETSAGIGEFSARKRMWVVGDTTTPIVDDEPVVRGERSAIRTIVCEEPSERVMALRRGALGGATHNNPKPTFGYDVTHTPKPDAKAEIEHMLHDARALVARAERMLEVLS